MAKLRHFVKAGGTIPGSPALLVLAELIGMAYFVRDVGRRRRELAIARSISAAGLATRNATFTTVTPLHAD